MQTIEEVEAFVLAMTNRPSSNKFSRLRTLWHKASQVANADAIKASLNELDNKLHLHLEVRGFG
jgi:hypothetical protein